MAPESLPASRYEDDERLKALFRATNIEVALIMIRGDMQGLRRLADVMALSDEYGNELRRRHEAKRHR